MSLFPDRHACARAAAERLFTEGSLGAWCFRGLQGHLLGCAPCRDHYDRLSAVKRALEPGNPEIPLDELAQYARAAASRSSPRIERARRAGWGLAAALGATLGLLVLIHPRPRGSEGVFTARGAAASAGSLAGIRAFCLSPDGTIAATVELQGPAAAQAPLRCGLADSLQFTYTFPARAGGSAPGDARLWLLSLGPDGRSYVYRLGADEDGVALSPGVRDRPIPSSVRLSVRHEPGRYDLIGVVATRALGPDAVLAAARGGRVDGATTASATLELSR